MKNKNKYKLLIIILAVIIFLALILIWGKAAAKSEMILFYGDTCPHCKKVEEYIAANNIKTKFKFQELEVYNNQTNAQLLGEKARQCGLNTNQGVDVPFFFDGQKCLLGDQDIINYFQK